MDYFIGIFDYIIILISTLFNLMLSNWLLFLVLMIGVISIVYKLMLIIRGK